MNALVKTHPPFTSAEFYKMANKGAFAGLRVELRRGMILKMSPQYYPHASVKDDLTMALKSAVARAGLMWRVISEVSVSFAGGFEPMPDIVVFDPAMLPDASGPIPGAAMKLIVEVSDSTLADDMGDKREDYAQAGLAEYWVADVAGKLVHRHAGPAGAGYARQETLALGEPLAMLMRPDVVAR